MVFTIKVAGRDGAAPVAAVDPAIARIRHLLDRALHPTTPRAEAENAMRLAARAMRTHNLEQTDVMLASAGDAVPEALRPGRWMVFVADNERRMRQFVWLNALCEAVCKGFGLDYFYDMSDDTHLEIVFYGLDSSAEAAAHAFVRYFRHLDVLALRYRGKHSAAENGDNDDDNDDDHKSIRVTARERSAYREGLSKGLMDAFETEIADRDAAVAELEARNEKQRRALVRAAAVAEARRRHAAEVAAHTLKLMEHNMDVTAPLTIVIPDNDDEQEAPDPTYNLAAHEHEVTVCRALAVHTDHVGKQALGDLKVESGRTRKAAAEWSEAQEAAFADGVRDAKKIRLR